MNSRNLKIQRENLYTFCNKYKANLKCRTRRKGTFTCSNTLVDYMHATSSTIHHLQMPPSSKPLTPAPKRAWSSIHLISSGRAFQRRQASTVKDLLKIDER
uniref:Uncharacterized protein n=1 Tax=Cuerna arida TaxID=1464854 RepID=A0A1B6GEG6_9HEMI